MSHLLGALSPVENSHFNLTVPSLLCKLDIYNLAESSWFSRDLAGSLVLHPERILQYPDPRPALAWILDDFGMRKATPHFGPKLVDMTIVLRFVPAMS